MTERQRQFKILLIQPPVEDFYDTDIRLQPIGLGYLKAAVIKHIPATSVAVRDYHQGHGRCTIPIPSELEYLREYYALDDKSPFSAFSQYYRFGASYDEIAAEAAEFTPDLIGISSLFSPYYRETLRTAAAIRKQLDVPIVVGGSHVSAEPEMMLRDPAVDFVIRGEGERAFVELVRELRSTLSLGNVPNLGFKTAQGEMVLNPIEDNYPIDEIPIPDFTDLPANRYQFARKPLTFVVTSRSCPHRCTFCSVHTTFGLQYRRRSVENVITEIQQRYNEGYRVIDFEDDNLTLYVEEMKSLCRELIRMFPANDVQLTAMNGISYLSLDEELLCLMHQAGFTHLNLALVSSDKTVRETTKRPHTVKKYLEVVNAAHRLGFRMVSYQILGLPSESLESMVQTLVFAARLPVLLGASMFYLTPQSPIAKQFKRSSETDIFLSRLSAMAHVNDDIDRDDLYTLFVTTRILNFLKGIHLTEQATDTRLSTLLEDDDGLPHRAQLGMQLLRRLLTEGVLYACNRSGTIARPRFKTRLFASVWRELGHVQTRDGAQIVIDRPCVFG